MCSVSCVCYLRISDLEAGSLVFFPNNLPTGKIQITLHTKPDGPFDPLPVVGAGIDEKIDRALEHACSGCAGNELRSQKVQNPLKLRLCRPHCFKRKKRVGYHGTSTFRPMYNNVTGQFAVSSHLQSRLL